MLTSHLLILFIDVHLIIKPTNARSRAPAPTPHDTTGVTAALISIAVSPFPYLPKGPSPTWAAILCNPCFLNHAVWPTGVLALSEELLTVFTDMVTGLVLLSPSSARRCAISLFSSSNSRSLHCKKWAFSCSFWATPLGVRRYMYWSLLGFCEKLPHLTRPLSLRARRQKLVLPRLTPRAPANWRWVQAGFCSRRLRSLR